MAKVAISNLNPIQQLILDKIEFDDARDKVKQGEYEINLDLHVEGKVKIGKDFWQVCWTKMRPLVILQYALNKLNSNCRQTVLEEAFEWYSKMTDKEREEIDSDISVHLKAAEEVLKAKTISEKQQLETKLPEIKDEVKEDVNNMKCWSIEKCRGRVSFSGMSIKIKE